MGRSSTRGRARVGLVATCAAVVLAVLTPTPAHADFWCWLFGSGCGKGGASEQQASPQRGAPEIDPGALGNAIALAAGGAVLVGNRLRRRRR